MKIASRRSKRCQINCPFDWATCSRVRQDPIFFLVKYSDETYDDSVHRASLVSWNRSSLHSLRSCQQNSLYLAFCSCLSSPFRLLVTFVSRSCFLSLCLRERTYRALLRNKRKRRKRWKGRRFAQSYRTWEERIAVRSRQLADKQTNFLRHHEVVVSILPVTFFGPCVSPVETCRAIFLSSVQKVHRVSLTEIPIRARFSTEPEDLSSDSHAFSSKRRIS